MTTSTAKPSDVPLTEGESPRGQVPRRARPRPRRHGRGRRRAAHPPPAEASPSSSSCPTPRRRWSSASSARRARPCGLKSEHVARVLDVGDARGRRALHGHGVPRGQRPLAGAQEARPAARRATPSTTCSRPARPSPRRTQLGIVHRDLKPANLFLTKRADGSPWSRCSTSASRRTRTSPAPRRQMQLTRTRACSDRPTTWRRSR